MSVIKCIKCLKTRQESQFSFFHGRRNKTCTRCRTKNNEWYTVDKDGRKTKAKTYYLKNKIRIAAYRSSTRLKNKYKLSEEDYKKMIASQKGCSICNRSFEDCKPCIDHDHVTGAIRGLLCRKCNLRLFPLENKEFRLRAEIYLNSRN